jgi:hypothetical protein
LGKKLKMIAKPAIMVTQTIMMLELANALNVNFARAFSTDQF